MFDFGLSDFWRFLLTALLALWAVFLFGGFIFGRPHDDGKHRMPTWTRMASSFMLVVAAWSWLYLTSNAVSLLVALGMTLGFIGDLFMARMIPMKNHVLGGIASFGLGHILYIAAFLTLGHLLNIAILIVCWLIGLAGWYFAVFRGQKATPLHYAALPYALLLSSTAGFATTLAIAFPALFVTLAVGAALFLLSDLILAAQLFNGLHFPLISDVVWLTYGPAQMLIVYSMIGAMAEGKI